FSDTTFEDITNSQLLPNLLYINGPALVGKAGIAGDHEETAEARQGGDDLLDDAIREILLISIAAQIVERQNGDGWLVRQWKALLAVRCTGWQQARFRR